MLTSLLTRNPFRPRSSTTSNSSTNSDAADPGFDSFIATLRARRSSDEWGKEGPEGDLYRLRCLAEEMTLLSERNYGCGGGRRKYHHQKSVAKAQHSSSWSNIGTII
ncbi:unnamed protein product [Tuber aestivum]|uniref:Uncharacterized protein n=1 Tax=Tuber aestivum TaxID=59557 RepID=A0A292Q121_9PEZI|nr:unnamed protein product [Tuber aestivum]